MTPLRWMLITLLAAGVESAWPTGAMAKPATTAPSREADARLRTPHFWLSRAEAERRGRRPEDRAKCYADLARAYATDGDIPRFRRAVGWFRSEVKKVTDPQARVRANAVMASAFARVGDEPGFADSVRAARAAASMTLNSFDPQALVRELASIGAFDQAVALARTARTPGDRCELLALVAVEQAKAGRRADYEATMGLAEAEAEAAAGQQIWLFEEQIHVGYRMLLAGKQIEAGDCTRAEQTTNSFKPEWAAWLYARIAAALVPSDDRKGYERNLQRAIKAAELSHQGSDRYHKWVCVEIGKACAMWRDEVTATRIARRPNLSGQMVTMGYCMESAVIAAEAGDAQRAKELWDRGRVTGSDRDYLFVYFSHRRVMEALGRRGNLDHALALCQQFLSPPGSRSPAGDIGEYGRALYAAIAETQAAAGRFRDARAVLTSLDRDGDSEWQLFHAPPIARAAGKSGHDLDDLLKWIEGFRPWDCYDIHLAVAEGLIEARAAERPDAKTRKERESKRP